MVSTTIDSGKPPALVKGHTCIDTCRATLTLYVSTNVTERCMARDDQIWEGKVVWGEGNNSQETLKEPK